MTTIDPDHKAAVEASARLKEFCTQRRIAATAREIEQTTHGIICDWIKGRSHNWSALRGSGGAVAEPDPMMIGFARSVLGRIVDALPDFNWHRTFMDLGPDEAAQLFAVAHAHVQAATERTLENPDDKIPF